MLATALNFFLQKEIDRQARRTGSTGWHRGVNADNGRKLLLSLAFIAIVVVLASRLLRGLVSLMLRRVDHATVQARFWTRQAISLAAAIILILGLLSIWFSDPTRLATAAGLMSAGLAFALQQPVTAIASYFVILRGNTFTVGDRISMGGVRGDVMRLGFIQTTIMEMGEPPSVQGADPAMWVKSRQFTGRIVTVSNAKIFAEPVFNYTRDFPFIWEEMAIPITYQADRAKVEAIMLEAAQPSMRSTRTRSRPSTRKACRPLRGRADRSRAARVLPHHRQLARADGAVHRSHPRHPRRQGCNEPLYHRRAR